MKFGEALVFLEAGHSVCRTGWNGEGMFLYLVPANNYPAETDVAKQKFGDMVPYKTYIAMKTVDDDVVPWLASHTDLLSDDWQILD